MTGTMMKTWPFLPPVKDAVFVSLLINPKVEINDTTFIWKQEFEFKWIFYWSNKISSGKYNALVKKRLALEWAWRLIVANSFDTNR